MVWKHEQAMRVSMLNGTRHAVMPKLSIGARALCIGSRKRPRFLPETRQIFGCKEGSPVESPLTQLSASAPCVRYSASDPHRVDGIQALATALSNRFRAEFFGRQRHHLEKMVSEWASPSLNCNLRDPTSF